MNTFNNINEKMRENIFNFSELKKHIIDGGFKDKILIWGACEKSNYILDLFNKNDIQVVGYIDRKFNELKKFNNIKVYDKDILKTNKYYIYISLEDTYTEIIDFLVENNYIEFKNYWYPNRKIYLDGSKEYSDLYGNKYLGNGYKLSLILASAGEIVISNNCKISEDTEMMVTHNSKLEISEGCRIINEIKFIAKANARIFIDEKTTIKNGSTIWCRFNSNINIGKKVRLGIDFSNIRSNIVSSYFSNLIIENKVTVEYGHRIISAVNGNIIIDEDSMISYDVTIRSGNSHNLWDIENAVNLSSNPKAVKIGKHVWIGQKATLFAGCNIDDGSVVGINSFVNKKFPKNCSIAGNPAKIIKNNIAWRREAYPLYNSYENFMEFDFREN